MCAFVQYVPEVHLLHLDMAVNYFVQLYTMYPCNFMDYLKARYGPKGKIYIFKRHIAVNDLVTMIMLYKIMTIVISSSKTVYSCYVRVSSLCAIIKARKNASRVSIPVY